MRQHVVFMCFDMFSKKENEGPVGGIDTDFIYYPSNFFPHYFVIFITLKPTLP